MAGNNNTIRRALALIVYTCVKINRMPYVKIMIHAVWGTKNREPLLLPEPRKFLISHIKENAIKKEIYIDTINGEPDHIHCLFGLNADMPLSKAIGLIKGESSYWINKEKIIKKKFEWADEYYASSVSQSQLDKVRDYIRNQQEHHRKMTFKEECDKFLQAHGFNMVMAKAV